MVIPVLFGSQIAVESCLFPHFLHCITNTGVNLGLDYISITCFRLLGLGCSFQNIESIHENLWHGYKQLGISIQIQIPSRMVKQFFKKLLCPTETWKPLLPSPQSLLKSIFNKISIMKLLKCKCEPITSLLQFLWVSSKPFDKVPILWHLRSFKIWAHFLKALSLGSTM